MTAHALRHTAASLMLSAGVNLMVVARCLGHADPSVTATIYASVMDADLTAAGVALDRYRPDRVATMWSPVGDGEHWAPVYEG